MEEAQAAAGDVGMRHRACDAVVEEAGASLPGSLEEMGATSVWKKAGASHQSSMGSKFEAGASDASTGNGVDAGGA
jgi:hypothetical protein